MGGKYGIITKEVGAYVSVHEQAAADFLARNGYDIEFLAAVRILGQRTPDITFNGDAWEIKTPIGNGSRTIENILRSSKQQSAKVVLDLRFTKRADKQCINETRRRFDYVRQLHEILIVTKEEKIVWLTR